jgi:hypothetical protein
LLALAITKSLQKSNEETGKIGSQNYVCKCGLFSLLRINKEKILTSKVKKPSLSKSKKYTSSKIHFLYYQTKNVVCKTQQH